MKIYLIAHTDLKGHNVACKTIIAGSSSAATKKFYEDHPLRRATMIGVKGDENAGVSLS